MKIDRRLALVALLCALAVSSAVAQTGFTFLEIPVGARESALGGSGVALVTGPTSAAHNPAALALLRRTSFVANSTRHFGDTRAQYFALGIRTKRLYIAPHFWGTRVPDIEYRTQPTQEPISEFDATYAASGVSVGCQPLPKLSAGLTLRYLYSDIQFETSEGWSSDAGLLWSTPVEQLRVGAAVNHLGNVNAYASEDVTLPTTLRIGGAWQQPLGQAGALLVTAEGAAVQDQTPHFSGGFEFQAPEYLALRVGYVAGLDTQGVAFGAGLHFKRFRVDYAFLPYKEELGEGHRVGLGIDF
ncbi:MAG: PorV/PorQ family protein [bacterium]|nr:PorV/PorQ family protein [bacterium]MBK8130899.1 PorV/PorQ family protein [bacterium]